MGSDLVPGFQETEDMSRRGHPRLTDDQKTSANPRPTRLPVTDGVVPFSTLVVERGVSNHPNLPPLRVVCGVGHALKLGLRSL